MVLFLIRTGWFNGTTSIFHQAGMKATGCNICMFAFIINRWNWDYLILPVVNSRCSQSFKATVSFYITIIIHHSYLKDWRKWPVSTEIWFMVSHSTTPVSDVMFRRLKGFNLKRALFKRLCGGSGGDSELLLSEKLRKTAWDGEGKIYNHDDVNETRGTVAGSSETQTLQLLEILWWPEKEGLCFPMK